MREAWRVIDDFCPELDRVKRSAFAAGFGTWRPNKGEIGSSVYEGMNFIGDHAYLIRSLAIAEHAHILPNSMFFRVTRPGMEKAYVHSDREQGGKTCIVYMSEHDDPFGTGFYMHKATGLYEMPTFSEMRDPKYDQLKIDMVTANDEAWEPVGYVSGKYNRALIFDAPLFHSRLPLEGIGETDTDSRLVWATHYFTSSLLENRDG